MDVFTKWKLVRIIITTGYLLGGWVLFTGTLALSSLLIGFGFSLLIAVLTYSVFIDETEAERRSLLPRAHYLVVYLLLIIYKMYIASFKVLFNVIRGDINPRVVHFRTRLSSDVARVLLANSITLTPGTITLNLDDDHLIVHWLDAQTLHSKYAGELIKGTFEALLKRSFI
ncbi:cation:proton antiporter [candidate division KSB3 bacterium]|uniref:Cation:proton antiporter n=1 Tax=candidate division KSB3 bacterium TaxID=2044937 RepID=A0A9D5JS35_9BACT|nr:cation:proton antiporter [candidate division KSB3 bacterium]MBD3323238.1 cation:proton antiporter [candidate division KSB3 bacterium]